MIVLRWINAALSQVVILIIRAYQLCISPLLPRSCRFTPTCSQYMTEAIRKKGVVVGLAKGLLRLMRCNPLFPGGHDPVR
ncbi:MAG: membrane protein insertion efficiency factor YidD [Planctomycetota bacterium]